MLGATLGTQHNRWIAAIVAIVGSFLLAALVDRLFTHRARRLASVLVGGELSAAVDTRLRVLRRVLEAVIVFIGFFIAISQFDSLDRLANSVLASSAIVAAAVGFASRSTLANGVAGILLAVTQPLRVGDQVTVEGQSGTVEDVRLTYTYLRDATGSRVVVPNERLASNILRNDTVLDATVGTEVSLWLAPEKDALRALDVLNDALPDAQPSLAEVAVDGTRVSLLGESGPHDTRAERENELRARAYAALHRAGLR